MQSTRTAPVPLLMFSYPARGHSSRRVAHARTRVPRAGRTVPLALGCRFLHYPRARALLGSLNLMQRATQALNSGAASCTNADQTAGRQCDERASAGVCEAPVGCPGVDGLTSYITRSAGHEGSRTASPDFLLFLFLSRRASTSEPFLRPMRSITLERCILR